MRVQARGSFQNPGSMVSWNSGGEEGMGGDTGAVSHAMVSHPPGSCGSEPRNWLSLPWQP